MRNFLSGSSFFFLLFLLAGCFGTSHTALQQGMPADAGICLRKLRGNFNVALYRAEANIMDHHLSGLLIFKKMADSTTRVVFTSETGIKFFDFEYAPAKFRVKYCIKQLNKKIVIRQLQKDIGFIIWDGIDLASAGLMLKNEEVHYVFRDGKDMTSYITDQDCSMLRRIEFATNHTKKIILNLAGLKGGLPDSVYIAHQTFNFNIGLKQIER